jgi:hypothetical protein
MSDLPILNAHGTPPTNHGTILTVSKKKYFLPESKDNYSKGIFYKSFTRISLKKSLMPR